MSSPRWNSKLTRNRKNSDKTETIDKITEPNTLNSVTKGNTKATYSNSKIEGEIKRAQEAQKLRGNYNNSWLASYCSQQAQINKCDMKLEKFKRMALSKKRQHSSSKSKTANYSKVSEERENSPNYLQDNKWEEDTKPTKSERGEVTKNSQE